MNDQTQTTTRPWEPQYGFCARNDTDPERLARALEAVRKQICGYGAQATRCDCKYGLGRDDHGYRDSEQTGCPELREVIHKLLHRAKALAEPTTATLSAEVRDLLAAHKADRGGWDAEARRLRDQIERAIAQRDEARAGLNETTEETAR